MLPRISASVFILFALVMSGCQATRRAELEESVDSYVKAISRGDQRMAMVYVDAKVKPQFETNLKALEGLKVSDSEIQTIYPDEKMENALVSVFYEYFSENGAELKTAKRFYSWSYNSKARAWFLADAKPFGRLTAVEASPASKK